MKKSFLDLITGHRGKKTREETKHNIGAGGSRSKGVRASDGVLGYLIPRCSKASEN